MPKLKKKHKKGVKEKPIPIANQRNWNSPLFLNLLAVVLIVVLASVVYLNSFHVSFRFDDIPNILYNPNVQIKIFSWDRLEQSLRITYGETIRVFSYFTFAINYYFGGVQCLWLSFGESYRPYSFRNFLILVPDFDIQSALLEGKIWSHFL